MTRLVLDTNIVLDAFVFGDAAAQPLRTGLHERRLHWVATAAMRDELERVLGYPQIAARMGFHGLAPADVLDAFDRHATRVEPAAKAPVTCGDPDDQMFIDLAVRERATLLSKDRAVLSMHKRLALHGVRAAAALA